MLHVNYRISPNHRQFTIFHLSVFSQIIPETAKALCVLSISKAFYSHSFRFRGLLESADMASTSLISAWNTLENNDGSLSLTIVEGNVIFCALGKATERSSALDTNRFTVFFSCNAALHSFNKATESR